MTTLPLRTALRTPTKCGTLTAVNRGTVTIQLCAQIQVKEGADLHA